MNERIIELAEQAGYNPLSPPTFADELNEIFMQKFAELIAQECMECVRDVLRDEASDLTYRAADQVQSRIRQAFDIQD